MKISALDENGAPVDWWFIYKVPQLDGGVGNDKATGYEYVYYDSTIDANTDPRKRTITKSLNVLNGDKGALNLTMDSVFKNFKSPAPSTGWVLYNDEMPESVNKHDDGTKGHTKGVLAFDTESKTAFWLLHSWPKFADPGAIKDPTPKYGQTYLCISLDLDTANLIAKQMLNHQEPQIYLHNIANLPTTADLHSLTQPLASHPVALGDFIDLKSIGGMPFKVIAKNREWNKDFWNELVGPILKDDLDIETWIRGPIPPIADSDGIHKTFDIKYINLGFMGAHWAWPETHDHAKWGVTLHTPWVCVGDINRMISQRRRGGCTIAFQNQTLWSGLSKTSLLLAPPGHNRTEAHVLIQKTHHLHAEAPLRDMDVGK
ncbi:deoxyribonuclease II family protein [Mucilaginibacter sp. cycad4]|uniref:deoxyribonuclease II family protein n=1 Tax=Mucilaginibacter sp. cycad4 TaxID=3342096 RepID=UPI002AAAC445|nr:deoxyribonuclease II family protein [Mucilaginibacter gossypii]WPV01541.1 deoxyribonuclease II family protein [Mucilaginibacter gossypii]